MNLSLVKSRSLSNFCEKVEKGLFLRSSVFCYQSGMSYTFLIIFFTLLLFQARVARLAKSNAFNIRHRVPLTWIKIAFQRPEWQL